MVSIKTYQRFCTTALSLIWTLQIKLIYLRKEKMQRKNRQLTIWLSMVSVLQFTTNNAKTSNLAAWALTVVSKSLRAWQSSINKKKALSANRHLLRSIWICSIDVQARAASSNRTVKEDLTSCCIKIASLSTPISRILLLNQTKSCLGISNKT